MTKISDDEMKTLIEVKAASDDAMRYWNTPWTRSGLLSGTRAQRSSYRLNKLKQLGLLESKKAGPHKQSKLDWKVSEDGLKLCEEHEKRLSSGEK